MENSKRQLTTIELTELNTQAENLRVEQIIELVLSMVGGNIIFTTSFGAEDQVLTHILAENKLPVDIITLDTGRLFNETLETFEKTIVRYGRIIKVLFPDPEDVERYVNEKGPNAFYQSVDLRKECCNIRKIKPLERGLKGYGIWITGLRADQSENRLGLQFFEWDKRFNILKVNPLLRWTYKEIMAFIHSNFIPYNLLHDKGYESIGCAPCTRAIQEGENYRAGRWWWETSDKECGLHISEQLKQG
jgi:phosophoadenylyl-sulfate reductase (thioredoxin)/thioredoxin-dependent adenylylsulfate APS reductase